MVFLGEEKADIVVEGPGDNFADERHDERGYAYQPGLGDAEVVGWEGEDGCVYDAEDHDPG